MRTHKLLGWPLLVLCACQGPLTREEAEEALLEIETVTQASTLANGTIEVTTDFTIGDAVERAAEQLRAFFQSQLPCAEIALSGATLTVEYGVNGTCRFRGYDYTGSHTVTVSHNDPSEVVVEHHWESLSNGQVELNGGAMVTWNLSDPSRQVVHELEWTRFADGRAGAGAGRRIQRPHEDGLAVGLQIEGEQWWTGNSGDWALDIDAVKLRWGDPVPYAGSYRLETPFDKSLKVSFARKAERRIAVTVASGDREFEFDVISAAP
jgi:hypothetical protein